MPFTLDSTLAELLNNPTAYQVLKQHVPDLFDHPMLSFAKGMTLRSLLTIPQVARYGVTVSQVEKVLNEINAKL
jgi:hypothetical protein